MLNFLECPLPLHRLQAEPLEVFTASSLTLSFWRSPLRSRTIEGGTPCPTLGTTTFQCFKLVKTVIFSSHKTVLQPLKEILKC